MVWARERRTNSVRRSLAIWGVMVTLPPEGVLTGGGRRKERYQYILVIPPKVAAPTITRCIREEKSKSNKDDRSCSYEPNFRNFRPSTARWTLMQLPDVIRQSRHYGMMQTFTGRRETQIGAYGSHCRYSLMHICSTASILQRTLLAGRMSLTGYLCGR